LAFIGMVHESRTVEGRTVNNIPYKKYDTPCWEGCCENELRIGIGTSAKVSWLLYQYMPKNNILEFDFNDWSDDIGEIWKEYLHEKAKE
jgi:hypothetical protein